MKKVLLTILSEIILLILIFTLTGCASNTNNQSSEIRKLTNTSKNIEDVLSTDVFIRQAQNAVKGDSIKFGTYKQDGDVNKPALPIEWTIIKKEKDRVLLLSKYILDTKPFNSGLYEVDWMTCSLRSWMECTFTNTAFTDKERELVLDSPFILSLQEVYTYLGEKPEGEDYYINLDKAVKCQLTDYAAFRYIEERINSGEDEDTARSVYNDEIKAKGNYCVYWLSTMTADRRYPVIVHTDGFINVRNMIAPVDLRFCGVRPAVWVRLSPDSSEISDKLESDSSLLGFITVNDDLVSDTDGVAGVCRLMGINYYDFDMCKVLVLPDVSYTKCRTAVVNLVKMGSTTVIFDLPDYDTFDTISQLLTKEFPNVRFLPIVK